MENPRPRSAGVTAAATFAILGCISALCVWAYIVLNLADTPASEQGHRFYEIYTTPFLLIALLPPLVLATLMRTAIGVLQLRPWARIASMVWAALALTVSLSLIAFRPFETFVIPEHFVHEVDSLRQLFAISFVWRVNRAYDSQAARNATLFRRQHRFVGDCATNQMAGARR